MCKIQMGFKVYFKTQLKHQNITYTLSNIWYVYFDDKNENTILHVSLIIRLPFQSFVFNNKKLENRLFFCYSIIGSNIEKIIPES